MGDDSNHSMEEPLVDTSMYWGYHCDGSLRASQLIMFFYK